MSLAFCIDHNVHQAIVDGLRHRGIDCLTALEDHADRLNDAGLLARATELDRVLFSQDTDLLEIAVRWMKSQRDFSGLVDAGQLNVTIGQAIWDLELIAKSLDPNEMRNWVEYLPI